MEPLTIFTFSLIVSISANVFLFFQTSKKDSIISGTYAQLKQQEDQLEEIKREIAVLRTENIRLTQYEGRFQELHESMNRALNDNEVLKTENEFLSQEKQNVQTQFKLISQKIEALQNEKLEWETDKQGILHKLSESLISKGGAVTEEKVGKATENLLKQFERVINKVSSLEDDGQNRDKKLKQAIDALLYPSGAGLSSETTLENILKSSGLRQKSSKDDDGDFILQSTFGSAQNNTLKRPDAIIYMPNNNYLIIDSKSSSHFIKLQEAIDCGDKSLEAELMLKIKDRMNQHLKDLTNKDYQKAQLEWAEIKEQNGVPPTVMTIMFLQTDKMLDIVRQADKDFEMKAYRANIPVATPLGLKNLLNISKYTILKDKQDKNVGKLKEEAKKLLDNVVSMFDNANKLGKKLKDSVDCYDSFAKTFNKNIATRAKNMSKLGVETNKKEIKRLETYEVATTTLEGEVEYNEEFDTISEEKKNLIEE